MLLSIITPCLNRVHFVKEAVESVLAQDYTPVEHIVVDGGSTDGTLDVLCEFEGIRLISEPDSGVYDALNKGIRMAKGEVIGHLNSDDHYSENVFAEIMSLFKNDPELDAVFGGAIVFEETPDGARKTIAEYSKPDAVALSLENITVGVPIINARFFRKRVYERAGLYSLNYRIGSDRDFLLRVALAKIKSTQVDRVIYYYRQHSGSLTFNPHTTFLMERLEDYLRIAESYLNIPAVPSSLAKKCRLWHSREAMEAALRAMKKGDSSGAFSYGIRGWRYDRLWPFAFSLFLMRKAVRRAQRKLEGGA